MDLVADNTNVEYIFDLVLTTLDNVNDWCVKDTGPVTYWVRPYPVLGTGKDGHPAICIALHPRKSGEPETPTPADEIRHQTSLILERPGENSSRPKIRAHRLIHSPSWSVADLTDTGSVPFGDEFLHGDPIFGFIHVQKIGDRRLGLWLDWTAEIGRSPFSRAAERRLTSALDGAYSVNPRPDARPATNADRARRKRIVDPQKLAYRQQKVEEYKKYTKTLGTKTAAALKVKYQDGKPIPRPTLDGWASSLRNEKKPKRDTSSLTNLSS